MYPSDKLTLKVPKSKEESHFLDVVQHNLNIRKVSKNSVTQTTLVRFLSSVSGLYFAFDVII